MDISSLSLLSVAMAHLLKGFSLYILAKIVPKGYGFKRLYF
jgi:hypothetical protein